MARGKEKIYSVVSYEEAYDILFHDPELRKRATLNRDELDPEARRALREIERLERQLNLNYCPVSSESSLFAMAGCVQG